MATLKNTLAAKFASAFDVPLTPVYTNDAGLIITTGSLIGQRIGNKLYVSGIFSISGTGTDVGSFSIGFSGITLTTNIDGQMLGFRKQGTPDVNVSGLCYVSSATIKFRHADGASSAASDLPGTSFGNVTATDYEVIYFNNVFTVV
jgi:hypothetical protein